MKKNGLGGTMPIGPQEAARQKELLAHHSEDSAEGSEPRPVDPNRKPRASESSPEAAPKPEGASEVPPPAAGTAAWNQLYEEFVGAESRRADRARRRAEEDDALREFEGWSARTTERLMLDIKRIAESRSREFLERTGHTLEVQYPSGPSIAGPNGDPEIRFLRLSLGAARVHIYSSHARGGSTHVHLLPSRGDSLQRNHRLVSEPGAFIVRSAEDKYELRFLRGDQLGKAGMPMSLDFLMYKAFRLMVRTSEDEVFDEPPIYQRSS